jgi:hypothetical protein
VPGFSFSDTPILASATEIIGAGNGWRQRNGFCCAATHRHSEDDSEMATYITGWNGSFSLGGSLRSLMLFRGSRRERHSIAIDGNYTNFYVDDRLQGTTVNRSQRSPKVPICPGKFPLFPGVASST